MALGGAIAAVLLVLALMVISKGERAAGGFGRGAAVVVRRLRPRVDPEAWAAALIRFQQESASGLLGRIGKATPTMLAFIVIDGAVLVACLRFVGVPGEQVGYLAVLAALLSLYPLTIFPLAGLGVLDASLIVLVNAEGAADPADLVAAMLIWRAATLLLPLVPGLVALDPLAQSGRAPGRYALDRPRLTFRYQLRRGDTKSTAMWILKRSGWS